MELKDFIERTLLDICEGVEGAKPKTKVAIAPGSLGGKVIENIDKIKFNVSVTANSSTEGGIKVFNSGASSEISKESIHQIEFEVPVIFNSYITNPEAHGKTRKG